MTKSKLCNHSVHFINTVTAKIKKLRNTML